MFPLSIDLRIPFRFWIVPFLIIYFPLQVVFEVHRDLKLKLCSNLLNIVYPICRMLWVALLLIALVKSQVRNYKLAFYKFWM